MEIKLINWDDTETIKTALKLVRDVFWDFEASQYDPEGIWAFDSFIEFASIRRQMAENRLLLWCAYAKENILIGALAVQPPCHVDLLYVDKRVHRKGVGRRMLAATARYFSKHSSCKQITVNAPPNGVAIYRNMGFEPLGEERVENGVKSTAMGCDIERAMRIEKG